MSNYDLTYFVTLSTIVQGMGTIFVAFAFFLSLLQMARSNKINQTAQYQSALQLMFDWRSDIIENPSLAKEFDDAKYFAEAFKITEAPEYFHAIKLFHIFEHLWLLKNRRIISKDMWFPWSQNVTLAMRQKTKRDIWQHARSVGTFHSKFVKFVDSQVTTALQESAKEAAAKEVAAKEAVAKEAAAKEAATKEAVAKEAVAKEAAIKEVALKETAAK